MKPYSKDLRLHVLTAVDAGRPREEVAKTSSVSMPTIKRWLKRHRETGGVEPKAISGRPLLVAEEIDAGRFVFVNECGSNTALAPLYAWSRRGERTFGLAPRN